MILILCLSGACILQAQVNLVRNGNFEEETTDTCATGAFFPTINPIKYWYTHLGGSSDYYKACSHDWGYSVPSNSAGFQLDASTGSSYTGIVAYVEALHNYKEYLMTELIEPLKLGHSYIFSMFLSRRDDFVLSTNMGFCIEHDSIANNDLIENYTPTSSAFVYQTDTTIRDCENWVKFSHVFRPSSAGLKHLVIGNFNSIGTQIDSLSLTEYCGPFLFANPYFYAYYFVDDVSLYCLDCDTTSPCPIATPDAFTPNADGMNDAWQPLFSNGCMLDSNSYLLHIFDRWGNLIFSSNSFNEPWKGNNTPLGTYVFYLQYDEKGTTRKKQGSIELLR